MLRTQPIYHVFIIWAALFFTTTKSLQIQPPKKFSVFKDLRSTSSSTSSFTSNLRLITTIGVSFFGSSFPYSSFSSIPQAQAAMANLADVGIKEFLVKDGRQFLRLTIPPADHQKFTISKSTEAIRQAQENLELPKVRFEQVGFTNPSAWTNSLKDINSALTAIKSESLYLTASPSNPLGNDPTLQPILENQLIPTLQELLNAARNKDIVQTLEKEEKASNLLAQLRLAQIPKQQLPFTIPSEYNDLPRLNGRATVEMVLERKKGFRLPESTTLVPTIPLTLIVDGYHAPITAGNFVDLVQKKFYDNQPINEVEQLTVQTGKRSDTIDGYIDPQTKQKRTIPLELFYKTDTAPVYGSTSDEDMRATETMALPFQAYGALGMGHDGNDIDSGSSQFFFLKWLQALNPPGRNTIDGTYSCFGYVVKNEDFLSQVEVGDRIVSAKVIEGLDNLIKPSP